MADRQITILDGGMSRELMRLGAPFRQPEWSALALMETPHLVRQAHLEFALAGADVITTNSYALVPFHIGEERFQTQGRELASLAGRLAREAADEASKNGRKVLVAGSLPPIFGSYAPENYDANRIQDDLRILVEGLSPWVDIWLGETFSLIAEARAVQTAIAFDNKPLWVAFCPDDGCNASITSPHLRSGEIVAEAIQWAEEANIEALLFNCCRPRYLLAALQSATLSLSRGSGLRLGAYANGFVERSDEHAANEEISAIDQSLSVQRYAEHAQTWKDLGVTILGGCCGIGVDHINRLASMRSTHELSVVGSPSTDFMAKM